MFLTLFTVFIEWYETTASFFLCVCVISSLIVLEYCTSQKICVCNSPYDYMTLKKDGLSFPGVISVVYPLMMGKYTQHLFNVYTNIKGTLFTLLSILSRG